MRWLLSFTCYVASLFLILSPLLSNSDQALAMHRSRTSAGFSLDIPLIKLVASMLRCALARDGRPFPFFIAIRYRCPAWRSIFYYPGAQFDTALLIQAFVMIFIQTILLKIALAHRPSPSSKGGDMATPFLAAKDGRWEMQRPYNFWQWKSPKPYVRALMGG